MENGVASEDSNSLKMGASTNANAARFAALQEKKKSIEETLAKRNQELRQLCLQEAELTGVIPSEMPLEPGESFPTLRRRVGTSFQLPEKLVKNSSNTDEMTIADLELQIQLHFNLAEAALGLANEQNMSKTMRRNHKSEYQKHKQECMALQEKLALLKEKNTEQQQLQQLTLTKKKARAPDQDDNISIVTTTTLNDAFVKSELRQSLRLSKTLSINDGSIDTPRSSYRPESAYMNKPLSRQEEAALNSGIYRLSLNGYKNYLERIENPSPSSYQPMMPYNMPLNSHLSQQHMMYSPLYQQHSPNMLMHSPTQSQSSPHMVHSSRSSPQVYNNYPYQHDGKYVHPNLPNRQSSPISSIVNTQKNFHTIHGHPSYRQYQQQQLLENSYRNPHQVLQPHQQYEQNAMTPGLGGCWKNGENGEMVWCNSNTLDANWQRDKRCGSLDRRKNKRIQKRISPVEPTISDYNEHVRSSSIKLTQVVPRRSQDARQLVRTQSLGSVGVQTIDSTWPSDDNSSCNSDIHNVSDRNRKPKEKEWLETSLDGPVSPVSTYSGTPHYHSNLHSPYPPPHPPQYQNHHPMTLNLTHQNLPHQNLPHIPHSPNFSSNSPNLPRMSPNHHRMSPNHHRMSPNHHRMSPNHQLTSPQRYTPTNAMLTSPIEGNEDTYLGHVPPPLTPKSPLEIPAESNPSPRVQENNMEVFNNNIPENCTVVQAEYEETKPFEMSDFYKYSTKFKKSPVKSEVDKSMDEAHSNVNLIRGSGSYQDYPNNSSTLTRGFRNQNNSSDNLNNISIDLSQLAVSDNFSAEMNAWYKDHGHQNENNNGGSDPKNRSTATLV